MIKRISVLGCEFCHKEFDNQTAADAAYLCPECPEGRAEKVFKESISKLESDFQQDRAKLEQKYEEWLANNA